MTDTNQKLREAFPCGIAERLKRSVAWLERGELLPGNSACIGLDDIKALHRLVEALALPTADHLPNAGKMTNGLTQAETDASASVYGLTAAPVGERAKFDVWKKTMQDGFNEWDAWQARAALSAGDAVDGLPVLPKAERIEAAQFCDDAYWFSAEQMTAYATAAVQQYKEDAQRWKTSELISRAALTHPDKRTEQMNIAFNAYRKAMESGQS